MVLTKGVSLRPKTVMLTPMVWKNPLLVVVALIFQTLMSTPFARCRHFSTRAIVGSSR